MALKALSEESFSNRHVMADVVTIVPSLILDPFEIAASIVCCKTKGAQASRQSIDN